MGTTEPEEANEPATRTENGEDDRREPSGLSELARLEQVKWHLDRYDRLRGSTATRSSVVLGAGAILSAGNAVIFGEIIGSLHVKAPTLVLVFFSVAGSVSVGFVLMSLLYAAGVLVTRRVSRDFLADPEALPSGAPFNGRDVIERHATFSAFHEASAAQPVESLLRAAHVELWIGVHQYRRRYDQLRKSVRFLRVATILFLVVLVALLVANLAI